MIIFLHVFYLLFLAHCVADFALQSREMGAGKNRNRKPENIPEGQVPTIVWPYWLTAHAGIHGMAVYLVTGSAFASLFELIAHWIIDFNKCDNRLTVHQDQALHILCKIFIAFMVAI